MSFKLKTGVKSLKEENNLFKMIVEYLKLRGFAYAAHWMETYKHTNKKNVKKKTRALRTNYNKTKNNVY